MAKKDVLEKLLSGEGRIMDEAETAEVLKRMHEAWAAKKAAKQEVR